MLAIVFMLARILGVADYGRLTLAQGLVNTAQIFVVLGAGTMLSRYIPAMLEESVQRAVEIINLCAIMVLGAAAIITLGGFFGASVIATRVLDLSSPSPVPHLLLAWVVLTSLNSLLLAIMLSFEKGGAMGLVSFVAALLSVATVPLLALSFGFVGAIIGLITIEIVKGTLLVILYARLLTLSGVAILTPIRRTDIPLLWRFGLPVFLNSALWGPTIWLAQFILKVQAPDGLNAVGVFGFANNLLGVVIIISSLTNRAALPIQASLHARGEHGELKRMSWLLSLVQTGVAALIALPAAIMAPAIMAGAGEGFSSYWPVLSIMAATGVIIAGQTPLGNHILVNQRPYFIVITLLPWAAILLGAAFVFAPHGAYALAGGLLTASIVRSVLFYWGWLGLAKPLQA